MKPITEPSSIAPWGVRAALAAIRVYKLFLSPHFRGSCRFLPGCADYAAEAITRHGLLRGGWLAARRLARCHPLCAAGYDPVPLFDNGSDHGPTWVRPRSESGSA